MKVIDFECDTPVREVFEDTISLIKEGKGFDKEGYAQHMGPGWAKQLGITMEEFDHIKETQGLQTLAIQLTEQGLQNAMSHEDVIAMLDDANVAAACVGNAGRKARNEDIAAMARKYPDRLVPWFRIWASEGVEGVKALELGVKELGCKGFEVAAYRENLYINDKRYFPFYAKCVELGIPTRITTGLHLLSDRPYDYAHPRYLDEIARVFPDLKIVAGLAGWPWVPDLVAVASRHQNIYIDFACRRVKNIIAPGSGYEMLLYYGNRILQDKILFASGWGTLNIPLKTMIKETESFELRDSVRKKWMYENAAQLLGLG